MPSLRLVDAGESTLVVDAATIAATSGLATITATFLDASGNPLVGATDVSLASTGTGNTITAVSARTSAAGVFRWTFASTVEEAKTLTASAAGLNVTQTVAVTVSAGAPAAPAFVFESDWANSTGQAEAALRDGTTWDMQAGGDQTLSTGGVGEVVTAASVGFTDATGVALDNVFRCRMRGSGPACTLQVNDALTISTTHYGRFWFRNDEYGSINTHPTAYNQIHGSDPICAVPMQRFANEIDGSFRMAVGTGGSWPTYRFYSPLLDNETWYRYEWEMRYLTATTFRFYPRIYSAAGALLYDESDFFEESNTYTLDQWWALGNSTTLADGVSPGTSAELARNFGIGNEGPDGAANTGGYFYFASVRLSEEGWIGAAL